MGCTDRLLHAKYCMAALELVGILKSCPAMLARIKAPLEKGIFYHIWALVSWGKLSFVIKHGLDAFLQD